MRVRPAAILLLILIAADPVFSSPSPPAPANAPRKAVPGARGGATDFSGVWELDPKASQGGAPNMEKAVLEVSQKGNRIWIQPVGETRQAVLSEEVVVDGRTYEKTLGRGGRGTLTAKWGTDSTSLWLEVVAGTQENPRAGVQRSVWRLSKDRGTWVRETVTLQGGQSRQSRLVFRRTKKS